MYLPFYSDENLHEYIMYIGRLCSVIEDYDSCEIVIMGDFSGKPDDVYFAEWRTACDQYSLTFSDVGLLPSNTFFQNLGLIISCLSQSVHMSQWKG